MSSILTNNSAMVALQTLKSVNSSLSGVQSEISTGLKVGAAKDNAAVFAISQVMKSDVAGFEAVSDSLSLGASTVAVASSAASTIGETLQEIKTKIVSAQESNVDRDKLDAEITSLVDQVKSVVGAAQFNGLNLIDGTAGSELDILSSLDRGSDGSVTTGKINVDLSGTNLSTSDRTAAATTFSGASANAGGDGFSTSVAGGGATSYDVTFEAGATPYNTSGAEPVATTYSISVGDSTFEYTAKEGDDTNAVAYALRDQIEASDLDVTADVTPAVDTATGDVVLNINNDGADAITMSGEAYTGGDGGLAMLDGIDVSSSASDSDRATALTNIETMIDTVIDAQATFGTAESRIETQGNFLSALTDSFTSGIGSLVDADLEDASARLQALQVQQQLGTQALSIANQAPQQLLSLFR